VRKPKCDRILCSWFEKADLKATWNFGGNAEHSVVDDRSGIHVEAAERILLGLRLCPVLRLALHSLEVAVLHLVDVAPPPSDHLSLGKQASTEVLLRPTKSSFGLWLGYRSWCRSPAGEPVTNFVHSVSFRLVISKHKSAHFVAHGSTSLIRSTPRRSGRALTL